VEQFDFDDLVRLNDFVKGFQRHVSLPNILTEASNLLGSGSQQLVRGAAIALGDYCKQVAEVYLPSTDIVDMPEYTKLGLADAAVCKLVGDNVTVLTIDHDLFGHLSNKGVSVINLLHFKTPR
jgi:hypothetical protein